MCGIGYQPNADNVLELVLVAARYRLLAMLQGFVSHSYFGKLLKIPVFVNDIILRSFVCVRVYVRARVRMCVKWMIRGSLSRKWPAIQNKRRWLFNCSLDQIKCA